MKKLLLSLAIISSGVIAVNAQNLELTFERTGTSTNDVTVSTNIEGVDATLVSASHAFKASAQNVTSAILCPDVNGNSGPTIEFVFSVTGLDNYEYNTAGLHIHALNASGIYQQTNDNKARQFNVDIQTGNDETSLASFGGFTDIDIAAGVTGANKLWTVATEETKTAGSPLVIKVVVTKGTTNNGCFFGLSKVELSADYSEALAEYRNSELAGIKNQPGLFNADNIAAVETIDLTTFTSLEAGKTAIDQAIENVYAELDGKTFTIHNVFNHTSGTQNNFYLSAKNGTQATGVAETTDNNAEWTLTHVGGNRFTMKNGENFIASQGHVTLGMDYGGPDVTLESNPETPAAIAIEPYAHENYAETNTVALRCADMTDAHTPANGPRVYIQLPNNFTDDVNGIDNTVLKYYSNPHATDATLNPAKKGAWVLTAVEPGSTTSISEIDAAKPAVRAIYDLQGRRLTAPIKGINIINGKKVLVK